MGELISYELRVNGREHDVTEAWLGENLLYVLRERLGLPGSKNACEQGECGSCSVLMDGTLVCACMVLAASAVGRRHRDGRGPVAGRDASSRTSRRRSWPKARSSAASARRAWS